LSKNDLGSMNCCCGYWWLTILHLHVGTAPQVSINQPWPLLTARLHRHNPHFIDTWGAL